MVFNEKEFYYKSRGIKLENEEDRQEEDVQNENDEEIVEKEIENKNEEFKEEQDQQSIQINRTGRKINMPQRYNDYELYMAFDAMSYINEVPETVNELKNRDDEHFWRRAMERELESIERNNTWIEVEIPNKAEILTTKWVFAAKPFENTIEDRFKARLVVRGFAQKDSFNYDEIYAPVTKMTTIRTLLSIGNQRNYIFQQLDVKNAFLNGHLREEVYVYPPDGVYCKEGYILKLNKSLYGLKQAAKCWNEEINKCLIDLGFRRSENDYCLYIKEVEKEFVYLLIYVDDICLIGPDSEYIEECKKQLMKRFQMKDKGNLKHFLGLEIDYNREKGILKISQKTYIEGILKRFGFENCNSVSTPIDPKLRINNIEGGPGENKPVRELVGCLMYLMLGSRPDISYTINFFSRFQDKYSNEVWTHLKRVLRYLKGTVDMELTYTRNMETEILSCYVDSDWATDVKDRKSVSGYFIKIFGNTIAWVTRKQNCVALSSTEAELVALCSAVQDSLWFKKLLNDMNIFLKSFKVYEDNQGCIALIKNPENNKRVKHIDLKYNFVCEHLKDGVICLEYLNSKLQLADMLTKGLSRIQFYNNCKSIGLGFREG